MATVHASCYERLEQKKKIGKNKRHKTRPLRHDICQHKSKKQQMEIQFYMMETRLKNN